MAKPVTFSKSKKKRKADTSFNFGYNVAGVKKPKKSSGKAGGS